MIIYRSYIDHTQSGRILYYAESEETHYSLRVGGTTVLSRWLQVNIRATRDHLAELYLPTPDFLPSLLQVPITSSRFDDRSSAHNREPPFYHVASEALCSTTSNRRPGHIHDKNVHGPG